MKKFVHALILAVFAFGCWLTWAVLKLAYVPHLAHPNLQLPGFTTFCIELRPVAIILPILAAGYCLWVWFRKAEKVPSWVGFFAAATGTLVMITLPAMVAAYLPLLDMMNNIGK